MKKIPSYPKVLALGHKRIHDILDGDITVEEKLDGSQISFASVGGELMIRSKGAVIYADNPEKMFSKGVTVIKDLFDKGLLVDGMIYRGEYFQKPKHNTLAYNRVPNNHIMLFDIQDIAGTCLEYGKKREIAESLGLEVVPRFEVSISMSDDILKLLENESILGGCKVEGIVIKNYDKWTEDGKFMAGKYVSEAFKEKHEGDWKDRNKSGKDIVQQIIMDLRTEARWDKAIQHLKERGELTESPKDIGNLMKELQVDLVEEEATWIRDMLFNHFVKQVKRGVCSGFPEYYKKYLLKNLDKEE